jgi:hypothetical protein
LSETVAENLSRVRSRRMPVLPRRAVAPGVCRATGVPATVASRRSLPGRPFAPVAEAVLGPSLLLLASGLPGATTHGVVAVTEVPGPFGVADLVALVGRADVTAGRLGCGVPPLLNEADAAIVATLSATRPLRAETIASRLAWSAALVERRLPSLKRLGAVARRGNGWVSHPALLPLGRMHAFEAKVNDWRRGLSQACTYAAWADSASVVVARAPRTWAEFDAAIGCDGLGCAVGSSWRRRPRLRQHATERRLWASEHLVAALWTPPHHPSARA